VANEKTTFADAFAMADQVLYSGVACITDLMVKEGLINLDFADVRAVMREMGKAMMGTGEATGEKRALTAAEAAIANPLIDDSSMKGARGLLISITGGKDLTLYEVDEAATRIREEVDQEANIIVGATFDESLDGIIRVSVVATGIDALPVAIERPTPGVSTSLDSRLAELTQKLRANTQRLADRIERSEPAPRPATEAAPAAEPARSNPAPTPAPTMPPAAAIEDVVIRPMPAKPPLFVEPLGEPAAEAAQDEAAQRQAFIPPQPERAAVRPPRMPRVEDLPMPVQKELRASRGEEVDQAHPEKRRNSLLQRLASVGLGRRDEAAEDSAPPQARPAARPPAAAPAASQPERAPMPPAARPEAQRPAESRGPDPVSEYAKRPAAPRPAPQGLDPHGRPAPVLNAFDDDQLEIPAFLRRQAT